jgi:hypothetical protein
LDAAVILVMTDGVSASIDTYGTPNSLADAVAIARRGPKDLVDLVHATEASDPERVRWPRSKTHDDKAAVVIEFAAV